MPSEAGDGLLEARVQLLAPHYPRRGDERRAVPFVQTAQCDRPRRGRRSLWLASGHTEGGGLSD